MDYKQKIISMIEQIESERFLRQIWTILKIHIEKKGGVE